MDNISFMKDFQPLNESEKDTIEKVTEIIKSKNAVNCTACRYCVDGCPQHIAIPTYFDLYNKNAKESQAEAYEAATATFGKASECVGCGQCEAVCPQHLSIIELLQDVANTFEK